MLFHSAPTPRDLHSFPTRRSSDLLHRDARAHARKPADTPGAGAVRSRRRVGVAPAAVSPIHEIRTAPAPGVSAGFRDRKSTRLNSSHANISYAVFCLKKKKSKDAA